MAVLPTRGSTARKPLCFLNAPRSTSGTTRAACSAIETVKLEGLPKGLPGIGGLPSLQQMAPRYKCHVCMHPERLTQCSQVREDNSFPLTQQRPLVHMEVQPQNGAASAISAFACMHGIDMCSASAYQAVDEHERVLMVGGHVECQLQCWRLDEVTSKPRVSRPKVRLCASAAFSQCAHACL